MMRYLSLVEILELHEAIISSFGEAHGIRDIRALESAINQLRATFDKIDLYPDIISKAAALCFFIVMGHPFTDGNKRVGHAAMEIFLVLNGYEIKETIDEQEKVIMDLAAGQATEYYKANSLKQH
ncbi:MAG: type II toxin-antitoxin system death-on-curing family toxin [Deltaproteobacteria bacterium]|nr:MAG: type II toxin-antitoxin system death-on-curing family toxin [Deltaproteobacteria bacterium]